MQVISGLDLFSHVGANTPLVIADIRMLVGLEGELSIRLEGVTGTAILSGISIRKEATSTCMLLSNLCVFYKNFYFFFGFFISHVKYMVSIWWFKISELIFFFFFRC